jgi:hypothetical protein
MVGRGLRVLPDAIEGIGVASERREAVRQSDKPDCIVIDIVANTDAHSMGTTPESKDIPSLQGLVGLPSALDMEGRTLAEAVEEFEGLPEVVKAAAFRRQTSFSGLTATLTQVEMLAELEMPEELVEAGARLQWLRTGVNPPTYVCDLGYEVGSMLRRSAHLVGDFAGRWQLLYTCMDGATKVREDVHELPGGELQVATIAAEEIMRRTVPGIMRSGARDAPWRYGAPTVDQVRQLSDMGVDPSVVGVMNRGVASQMLTVLKQSGAGLRVVDGGQG